MKEGPTPLFLQGKASLSKGDIESVFALYDRVSDFVLKGFSDFIVNFCPVRAQDGPRKEANMGNIYQGKKS